MLAKLSIPNPCPPEKIPGYHLPENTDNLLSWAFVAQQMSQSRYYWLNTVSPNGHPHAVPVWGIWHENRVHFDGGPQTRWARNLMYNSQIAVHLPDGDKVVIIEGRVQILEDNDLDGTAWQQLDALYRAKYTLDHGSPYWVVHPQKVLAWDTETLESMTRWLFT